MGLTASWGHPKQPEPRRINPGRREGVKNAGFADSLGFQGSCLHFGLSTVSILSPGLPHRRGLGMKAFPLFLVLLLFCFIISDSLAQQPKKAQSKPNQAKSDDDSSQESNAMVNAWVKDLLSNSSSTRLKAGKGLGDLGSEAKSARRALCTVK
jgi:hypothetical protein